MHKCTVIRAAVFVGVLVASGDAIGQGTTAADFLRIGIGARACAMGGAYGAIADDPSAIHWNPAGLGQLTRPELMISQNFWLLDMSYQHAAGVVPTRFGQVGIGVSYSSSGEIPMVKNFLRMGEYTAYDASIDIAYALRPAKWLWVGVVGKHITEKIEDESTSTFAADIGLLYNTGWLGGIQLAGAVQNVGPEVKLLDEADPLPLNIKMGAAFLRSPFALSADADKTRDTDIEVAFGTEYVMMQVLALRAGHSTMQSFSFGAGLFWRNLSLDYAFLPHEDIDASHVLSLRFRFE